MRFAPERQHRRSIRLQRYDYSRVGAYFLTVCVQDRECLLGSVRDEEVDLTPAGQIVEQAWSDLPKHYPHLTLDEFVVMPNHIHGILMLRELDPKSSPRHAVAELVRAFKSFSSRRINKRREIKGAKVWQRNYYERVIRDEEELQAIRKYIAQNPLRWADDPENPLPTGVGFV